MQGYEKSAEAGVVLYQALGNSLSMMEIQMSDSSPTECWRARFETKQHAAVLAIMGYTSEVPLLGEVMPAASSIVFARPPTDRANWAPKLAALVYHLNNFASMLFYMAGDAADPSWTPASQQVSPSIFLRVNQPGPFLQQDMSLLVSLLAQPQPLPRATTVGEVEAVCGKDRRACLEWPREGSTLPEGAFVFGPWALRQDYEDAQRIGVRLALTHPLHELRATHCRCPRCFSQLSLRQGFDDYSMLMFVKIADFMGEWQQWSLPASQDATPLVINLAGSAVPYTVEAIVNASTHASPLEADWALLTDNAARAKLRSDLQSCSQRWDGGRPDRFTLSPGAQEALRGMQLPPTHGNLRLAQTMARYALPFRGWSGHPAVAANPQRMCRGRRQWPRRRRKLTVTLRNRLECGHGRREGAAEEFGRHSGHGGRHAVHLLRQDGALVLCSQPAADEPVTRARPAVTALQHGAFSHVRRNPPRNTEAHALTARQAVA